MKNSVRRALPASALLAFLSVPLPAAEVTLTAPGANEDLEESLQAASLSISAEANDVVDPQELVAAAQADYRRLLAALYDEGYFSGAVSILVDGQEASALSPLRAPEAVSRIAIQVDPGPAFRFSQAEVAPLPADATLPEGFAVGERASTGLMREAAESGIESWRQAGHAKARVDSQEITAYHERQSVAARFGIAPGPRLTFGETQLTASAQESAVRSSRIRAIAGIPEGEVFDPDEVEQAERRLRETGAFRSATVDEAGQINPGDSLDTIIDVQDAPPRRFGFGAEYSSVEGFTLSSFWLHRNLTGAADRFRIEGNVAGIGGNTGGIDYRLAASLSRPAFRHPDNTLRYGVTLEREDEPTYLSDIFEAEVGVDRYINERLTASLELGYRYAQSEDAFGDRTFHHLTFTGGATWNNRDSDVNPTTGAYANVAATPFVGLAGSESGLRGTADLRGYRALGTERIVAAARVQLGVVAGPEIEDVPPDYLFYSGGGGTVRGQGYQSLGVTMPSGQETGGRSFLASSLELRGQINDKWGAVAFVDYGYVAASDTFDGGEWHGGAGVGARYFTSLGPLRVDVAVPITGETDSVSLYIGIGQAF